MDEAALLSTLLQKAFQMAGERVPLGFDVALIQPTLAKLPKGPTTGLEPLFASVWPSEAFHLGVIELFGPERINYEHEELLPSCLIVNHGFIGIGSNGAGTIFGYCIEDRNVYLIPHEYVTEDAVYAPPWEKMEVTQANIKAISEERWDSLGKLLEWAIEELTKMHNEGEE